MEDFLAGKFEVTAESSQQEVPSEGNIAGKIVEVDADPPHPEASSKFKPPTEIPTVETHITEPPIQAPADDEPIIPEEVLRPRRKKRATRGPRPIFIPSDSEALLETEPTVNPTPSAIDPIPPTVDPMPPVVGPTPPIIDSTPPIVNPILPARKSLLDLPVGDRRQLIRIKKLKTQVTPLTSDELRVPSSSVLPPITQMETRTITEEERTEPTVTPFGKRKQPSDSVPSPARSPSPENIYTDPSPPQGLRRKISIARLLEHQLYGLSSMPTFHSGSLMHLSRKPTIVDSMTIQTGTFWMKA